MEVGYHIRKTSNEQLTSVCNQGDRAGLERNPFQELDLSQRGQHHPIVSGCFDDTLKVITFLPKRVEQPTNLGSLFAIYFMSAC